ncbi:HNH endonuclease family protein [Saccharothrix xinjiangensis]|uniref:HNH endonuclease family protein n=1 Tax=Saccharothrix xinjiangensis TaxID=204798 RepID=A0ABV9XYW7_9PSEU
MTAAVCMTVATVSPGAVHAETTARDDIRTGVPLRLAVQRLAVTDEQREGYERTKFKHWIDADKDGCNTRVEVLLEEAVEAPEITGRCTLDGGRWYSFYDDVHVDGPKGLDIDHMVPLAEAWDSGAYDWTPQRRQDYANDLGEPVALLAVTARSNRSKSDQDPTTWLPPYEGALCRYVGAWVSVKTRWSLTVDQAERDVLAAKAEGCPDEQVAVEPA